ncbi:MAG: sugar transporter substrate-binding protein, partial [Ilumatobacteraceae bacterium]|nr:sugar transporter substrate-binding protein [Ilumatobacteraceae bacterium]
LNTDVPSVLATPVAIYKDNVKDVIADGYQTAADVCKDLTAECTAAGITG